MNRDTQELRISHWPKLGTFPTTAGLVVAAIGLDYLTMFAWALGRDIPDGWLLFLGGLHSVATAHFGVKRKTEFANANVEPGKAP